MKRLLVVLCALGLVAAGATPAQAGTGSNYLALGDSVAFGTNPNKNPGNAPSFHGYPDFVSDLIQVANVNAACPGEATGGFISPTGLDNVCRPYRAAFPLHVAYGGTQLVFAESFLSTNPNTQLVTIDLGANDFFALQRDCNLDAACIAAGLPGLLANMDANLRAIFAGLRGTGYHGLIVALTYYALAYNTSTPEGAAGVQGAALLNNVMLDAAANSDNVLVADGFIAFQAVSLARGGPSGDSCVAGLRLVNNSTGQCDVHPTILGHQLLAHAILEAINTACASDASECINAKNNM